MRRRVHHAGASSFRCQRTAVSRRSSFGRASCLPTNRHVPGQIRPAPAPYRHVCKHGKMLVSPFVVDLCPAPPVALERPRDCLAAWPPAFRRLLLRPRSQTPAFQTPARLSRAPGITPAARVLPRLEPVFIRSVTSLDLETPRASLPHAALTSLIVGRLPPSGMFAPAAWRAISGYESRSSPYPQRRSF
jgi:hypothetical protein